MLITWLIETDPLSHSSKSLVASQGFSECFNSSLSCITKQTCYYAYQGDFHETAHWSGKPCEITSRAAAHMRPSLSCRPGGRASHSWRIGVRVMRPTHRASEEGTDHGWTLGNDLPVKSAVYGRSFLRSALLLVAGEVQVSAMTPVVTSRSFRSACSSSCCP